MCGFFSVIQDKPRIDLAAAQRALAAIAHRGPDASADWVDGHVSLGHRRLSIIDLKTGGQPIFSHDERYVVIFNGEIYNFQELRDRLCTKEPGSIRDRIPRSFSKDIGDGELESSSG